MSINLKLGNFEGPFDLLFHLIEKAEVSLYDIPISEITEQYFEYLSAMEFLDLEVASEFLIMAATLLEIKSKMLLPKPVKECDGEEALDPREELVQKLIEYKKYKEVSTILKEKFAYFERQYFKEPEPVELFYNGFSELPSMNIELLAESFYQILERIEKNEKYNSEQNIFRDDITIDDKMSQLMELLEAHPIIIWEAIFEHCKSKIEAIVSFLAILELIKMGYIVVNQSGNFESILIERVVMKLGYKNL